MKDYLEPLKGLQGAEREREPLTTLLNGNGSNGDMKKFECIEELIGTLFVCLIFE